MKTLACILVLTCLLDSAPLIAQTHKKPLQTYTLFFQTTVDGAPFSSDSLYQNHWNETYKVRSFKYYVSHIRIVYKDEKMVTLRLLPHLINEADSSSRQFSFSAPEGTITSVRFLLGIDSATNVSGIQSGDLDPAKGMFWIWNTGYIMAKLEGSSSASKAPGRQYSYDIGGYKPGENAAREINLSLAVSSQLSAISSQQSAGSHQLSVLKKQLSITNHQLTTFLITADIGKWFYGKHDLKISEQPMCHSPGAFAVQVADNYAAMFTIRVQ